MSDRFPQDSTSASLLRRLIEILGLSFYAHYGNLAPGAPELLSFGGPGVRKNEDVELLRRLPGAFTRSRDTEATGSRGEDVAANGLDFERKVANTPDQEDAVYKLIGPLGVHSYGLWPIRQHEAYLGAVVFGGEQTNLFDERAVSFLDLIVEFLAWAESGSGQKSERVRRLILQLSEAEERERRRIAEVFHGDLQQLIAGAKVHVDIAARGIERDSYFSERLQTATRLLHDVIERTRTLSHELSPATELWRGLVPALRTLAGQMKQTHGLSVELSTTGELPELPRGTTMIIYRAVQELLFNVAKHAEIDTATVRLLGAEDSISLTVQDHGKGFDLDLTLNNRESSGLGLVTVRDRIEAIGGVLEVDSKPGGGSSFAIRLDTPPPHVVDRQAAEAESRDSASNSPPEASGAERSLLTVLVVDDHAVIRQGLALLLNGEDDIQVVGEAESGEGAIDAVRTQRPQIVVMDYEMHGLNGAEATRRIKEEFPETKVIGLSMHREQEVARHMIDAGAEAYLPKEGPSEQVIAAIRRLMGSTNVL